MNPAKYAIEHIIEELTEDEGWKRTQRDVIMGDSMYYNTGSLAGCMDYIFRQLQLTVYEDIKEDEEDQLPTFHTFNMGKTVQIRRYKRGECVRTERWSIHPASNIRFD